jgi:hypothetical protein
VECGPEFPQWRTGVPVSICLPVFQNVNFYHLWMQVAESGQWIVDVLGVRVKGNAS